MTGNRLFVVGSTLVSFCLAGARPAKACSPPPQALEIVVPADGEQDRPRNHIAFAIYSGGSAPVSFALTGAQPLPPWEVVPLQMSGIVPFGSMHRLEIKGPLAPSEFFAFEGSAGMLSAARKWSTGTDVDLVPPRFDGLSSMTVEKLTTVTTCHPGPGFYATLEFPNADESAFVHIVEIDRDGASPRNERVSFLQPGKAPGPPSTMVYLGNEIGRLFCFTARALDLALNVTKPDRMCCATTGVDTMGHCGPIGALPPDAGAADTPTATNDATVDRPPAADAPGAEPPGGAGLTDRSGCACTVDPRQTIPSPYWLLIGLVLSRLCARRRL